MNEQRTRGGGLAGVGLLLAAAVALVLGFAA